RDFGAGSVPYESSRKTASEGLDIIDPAGWSGKSLEEIAAALRRRAAFTVPQSKEQATLTPTLSSSDGKTSFFSGSPVLDQPTPPISIELQRDHSWETGGPNSSSSSSSSFEPSNDTRVEIAFLPALLGDSQPKIVKSDLFSPGPTPNNRVPTPTAADVHGIATHYPSIGRGRCDFDTGSVPYKTSRKTAREGLDIIDPAGWSGKSLDEIAAALRRRAATTVPQSTERATSPPTLASSVGKTSLFSGPPVLDQPTPPTSGELRQDRPGEKRAPNLLFDSGFEPLSDTPVREAQAVVRKLPNEEGEEIVRDLTVAGEVQSSTNLEPDEVQSWALPPPSSPDAGPEKIKGASRTKKFIRKMVKRVKGTFKPKSLIQ
ncbi:hypothetical protein FRC01_012691, partial [Tulasnella sp. 417]